MGKDIQIKSIGTVNSVNGMYAIQLEKEFIPALTNISGFSHLQIIWWGHLYDTPQNRTSIVIDKPYKKGPEKLGVFATRSEMRPNPILISTIMVYEIDVEKGIIFTPYIDAEDGTAVLDIKPYHKIERINDCVVPQWCEHWPTWYEEAATFNWQNEFNF